MKTILAPLDFSEMSNLVVTEAATLARAIGARVVLLTIIQQPAISLETMAVIGSIPEIEEKGERYAGRQLAAYEAQLAADGIETLSRRFYGGPIEHITEQAALLAADYIVMGSHGHSALYDLLVGSTTHGVLLRARCPVVIVPAVKPAKPAAPQEAAHATV